MDKIFQVDSFTDEPFKGNPAGVCILGAPVAEAWMQSVAMEMNLSETAFIQIAEGQPRVFTLRWFTPNTEVSLCGHATLASAHILWEQGLVKDHEDIIFHTLSGEIRVWRQREFIWMDFPADIPERVEAPGGLLPALGCAPAASGIELYKGLSDYLIELKNVQDVLDISPDFKALGEIESRGFIVTARGGGEGIDFVSRFFAPALGIDEDPVTGSAHAALAPFWAGRISKDELKARQLSKRGGVILIRMISESSTKSEVRVHLGGKAVTFFSGEFS